MKIRTSIFYVFFVLTGIFLFVICSPILLLSSKTALFACQLFGRLNLLYVRLIGGIKTEIRGKEKLLKGHCIIACKHQSEWETFVLGATVNWPVFIIKKELVSVPFFGWFMRRTKMVAVDRKAGGGVMRQMLKQSIVALSEGKTLIIFPEGTRTEPGVRSHYKAGIGALYAHAKVPVIPMALNSGLFWSKGMLKRSGTAILDILDPIEPGLDVETFMKKLETSIEDASMKLYEEALSKNE